MIIRKIESKAWNCAERQKGKMGNGCKNIIIREDELLKTISEKLGWAWTDVERFDADRFMMMVQRVKIRAESVALKLSKAVESKKIASRRLS